MNLRIHDFDEALGLAEGLYSSQWGEIEAEISAMPLHLKASSRAGTQPGLVFDAVGTNRSIKHRLARRAWGLDVSIPAEFGLLGAHVGFGKSGVIVEVEFSKSPWFLNKLMRSELVYKAGAHMPDAPPGLLVLVTKARMLPAAQSTLDFEQASRQIDTLAGNGVLDIPIRLVGLCEEVPSTVQAALSEYPAAQAVTTTMRTCQIDPGPRASSRARLAFVDA